MTPMPNANQIADLSWWDKYGKSALAFLFAVWTVVSPLWFGDHHIDSNEGIIIGLAIGNNLLVFIVPLHPTFKSGKTIINAVLASLAVAQTLILDGLQSDDWPLIIGAALVILGVTVAPAATTKYPVVAVASAGLGD